MTIFSGYKRVNFRTYLKAEVLSTVIWAPLLLSLGFFFSQTALKISREVGRFSFVILLFVIGFFLFDKIIAGFYNLSEYLKNGLGINGNSGNGNSNNNGKKENEG